VIAAAPPPALAPLLVAAVVLAVAGVAKLRRPAPTGLALARLGLPGSDAAVSVLGAVEIVAAAAAAAFGGPLAAPVVVLYLGFAAVTAAQVRAARTSGTESDCGCFGDRSAPVGPGHVAVNLALAAGAAVGAASDGVVGGLDDAVGATVLTGLLAAVAAAGVRGLLTDLPAARAAADAA